MTNEKIVGMGFHHVSIKVKNYEKSVAFYRALGMKIVTEWGQGDGRIMMLDIGDGNIFEICAGGTDATCGKGSIGHVAFAVRNVDTAYAKAIEAGAKSVMTPTTMKLDDAHPSRMTIYVAFVAGPDGEEIEFYTRKF